MKLKSLLFGSAAAVVAVTGARAADVVIVEPEPVEYVRVCDTYGAGFFYIPGTETCLKLGGLVRVDYTSSHHHDGYTHTKGDPVVEVTDEQHHTWRYKIEVSWDARNDTEWGLLRSLIRFEAFGGADNSTTDTFSGLAEDPGSANTNVDQARIEQNLQVL